MTPVFLPYQQRWILDRSPVKVAEKSRRVGITWCTAYEACEVCSVKNGSNFWYQTYAEDDAKEFIEDVAKFARALDLVVHKQEEIIDEDEARDYFLLPEGERSIKITSVRFSTGFRCTSLPHLPRKLRGKGGVYCLDEAAFHDNLKDALKAAHAFRMWGGRVMIISTHNGVENEFAKLCEDIRMGKLDYKLHRVTLLDAVEQGLYKRICQVRGVEWTERGQEDFIQELLSTEGAEEEFLCIPARSGGMYFPPSLTEACMHDAPVFRHTAQDSFLLQPESERRDAMKAWLISNVDPLLEKLPKSKPHYLGVDFGRNSDMTVITPGTVEQDLSLRAPFSIELRNMPFDQQRQVVWHVIDKMPRFTFAAFDATGNGAWLAEVCLQRYGEAQIEMVKLSEAWYAQWLPPLKARFEEKLIALPRDLDIRQDFAMVEVINGVPKLPKHKVTSLVNRGEKRHGDTAISVALLNYSAATHAAALYYYEKIDKRAGHFAKEGIW